VSEKKENRPNGTLPSGSPSISKVIEAVYDKSENLRKVADIRVGTRRRKDMGDIDALAASISEVGLLQPIVIDQKNRLIAGERRLEAVKRLGWEKIKVHVVKGLDDAAARLKAERDENTCRKDFTPSEAAAIGKALERLERPKAEARKKAGKSTDGTAGGRGRKKPAGNLPAGLGGTGQNKGTPGKSPDEAKGDTRDRVAEAVGMSGRNYEKTKFVVEAAEKDPSLQHVVEEMDRTRKVEPAYKKAKEAKEARSQATPEPPPFDPRPTLRHVRGTIKALLRRLDGAGRQAVAAELRALADEVLSPRPEGVQ
jgi:ParB family chromosome partitioning protein